MSKAALILTASCVAALPARGHAGEIVPGIASELVVDTRRDEDGWLHVRVTEAYPQTQRVIVPLTPDDPTDFGYFVFFAPDGKRADFPRTPKATGSLFHDTFVFGRTVKRSGAELKLDRFQDSPLRYKTQWYIADRVTGDVYEVSCTYGTTQRLDHGYARSNYAPAATRAYYVTDRRPSHASEAVVCESGGAILFGAAMPHATEPSYRTFTLVDGTSTWSQERFGAFAPHHLGDPDALTDADRREQGQRDAQYAAARARAELDEGERRKWEQPWDAGTYCLLWARKFDGGVADVDEGYASHQVLLMDLVLTESRSPVSLADDVRGVLTARLVPGPSYAPVHPTGVYARNPFGASSFQPGGCDTSEAGARGKGFAVQRTSAQF